jgi:transposase
LGFDPSFSKEDRMDALIDRCCGLDVHQQKIVACVLLASGGKKPTKEIRTFGAFTKDLLALRDWLTELKVTHVGMESTGIYWRPVYAVLEGSFSLIVGNAQHMKNVPGRKTDVKDSEWIATLVRNGLVAPSFVPGKEQRQLRDLLRYRRKLVEARSSERNRLHKLLETANIKLASVASNIFGVSGMKMLHAMVDGTSTPDQMAHMAKGRLRSKQTELTLALDGRIEEHHRFLLKLQMRRLDQMDTDIMTVEQQVEQRVARYADECGRLAQIPGVDRITAAIVVAEVGVDMSVFKSAGHLASWVGVCPGNDESAGKRRSGRSTKGNHMLKTALVQAAWATTRTKAAGYLRAKYWRLKARRGPKRALLAIAHKILIAIYAVLSRRQHYVDLGETYLDERSRKSVVRSMTKRLDDSASPSRSLPVCPKPPLRPDSHHAAAFIFMAAC